MLDYILFWLAYVINDNILSDYEFVFAVSLIGYLNMCYDTQNLLVSTIVEHPFTAGSF